MTDILQHARVQAQHPEGDTLVSNASLSLHQHLKGQVLDIEDAAHIQDEDLGLVPGEYLL